jgi:hypothetical protein
MESIALQQGDCLKSSTSCSAVQYNILVLPLESLSDAVEKKNQV